MADYLVQKSAITGYNRIVVAENISKFWGREIELDRLRAWNLLESQITVIYGRRRVGKTRLVEHAYTEKISGDTSDSMSSTNDGSRKLESVRVLRVDGLEGQPQAKQRQVFADALAQFFNDSSLSVFGRLRWRDIFTKTSQLLADRPTVIFLDEFQWLAGNRSTLVSELKHAWDTLFIRKNKIHLVLCGSISSFMVKKVLRSSALYGRIRNELHVLPLRLSDIAPDFLLKRRLLDLVEIYMAVGGIPQYLKLIDQSISPHLNLTTLFFSPSAYLVNEFERIFASHFGNKGIYRELLMTLAKHSWRDRAQLSKSTGVSSGGSLTEYLDNLELAGFIESYARYDKSSTSQRGLRYRLSDPYLRFYFRFVHEQKKRINDATIGENRRLSDYVSDQAYAVWRGLAFEALCLQHHYDISMALGFSAVRYTFGSWYGVGQNKSTAQIDLLFHRADHVITVCELKYQSQKVGMDVIKEMERKIEILPNRDRVTIERVLISATGATDALKAEGYFHRILTVDDIFGRLRSFNA